MLINDIVNSICAQKIGPATWDDGYSESRLVATDGEIINRVKRCVLTGEYEVESTRKRYVSMEKAKAAAESFNVRSTPKEYP